MPDGGADRGHGVQPGMRTEAELLPEILDEYWRLQVAGTPRSIVDIVTDMIIKDALLELKPQIDTLVERVMGERAHAK